MEQIVVVISTRICNSEITDDDNIYINFNYITESKRHTLEIVWHLYLPNILGIQLISNEKMSTLSLKVISHCDDVLIEWKVRSYFSVYTHKYIVDQEPTYVLWYTQTSFISYITFKRVLNWSNPISLKITNAVS